MTSIQLADKFSLNIHRLVIWLETEAQDHLEELEITFSEFMVMYMITKMQATSQSQVADYTNHTEAAISRQVLKLIAKKMLIKTKHLTSRREFVLSLTPKGQEIFVKAELKLFRLYGKIFDSLNETEQIAFNCSIDKMSKFAVQNFSFLKNCQLPDFSNTSN